MFRVHFELTGQTPLLFHADDVEASDSLSEWRKAPENKNLSVAGDDRSPAWTWQTYMYSDGTNVAWPSQNIMVGLRSAGAQITLKKQKTYKEISQSGLVIESEFCDFLCDGKQLGMEQITDLRDMTFKEQADAVQDLGFRLFVKRARVGQAKHVRVRARFDNWTIRGTISVVAPEITYEALTTLFEIAGRGGQGDWRPNCKTPGPFGMFQAELKKAK